MRRKINPSRTAVICAAGTSFKATDLEDLSKLGDLVAINYVHIPWRKATDLKPTITFCADKPRKVFPLEWLEDPEIRNVIQIGHGREAINRQWTNHEVYQIDNDHEGNPFKLKGRKLKGPCLSLTLCYQWLVKQGYDTILFYGCDLKEAGSYAGVDFQHDEKISKQKAHNHDRILKLLEEWKPYTRPRLVNLSEGSALKELYETLTIREALDSVSYTERQLQPYDYAPVYNNLYANGYHANEDFSHAKQLAWYCTERLPERNGDWESVLDVGCSTGWALDYFRAKQKTSAGVDVALRAVQHCKNRGLQAEVSPAHDLPFDDNSFDLYFSTDVLEHVHPDDLEETITEAFRVSNRFVAVKICPFTDVAHWGKDIGKTLHLTVMPVQRWLDLFLKIAPEGTKIVHSEAGAFILDQGVKP